MIRVLGLMAICLLMTQAPAQAKFLDGFPTAIIRVPLRTSHRIFTCWMIQVLYARQEYAQASLLSYETKQDQ